VDAGLRPDEIDAPFEADVDTETPLVHAAAPVLDQLALDLQGARVAVVLTNSRAQVVDRRASERWIEDTLDRVSLRPGYVYAEDVVGTNGIGTALAQRAPAVVHGAEHFADALSEVACVGVPIVDPRSGAILGVLDLTCLAAEANPLMLPIVARAAREIEQRLIDESLSESLAIRRFLEERRYAKGALVLLTPRTMIANAAADRLVDSADEPALRECADRVSCTKGAAAELMLPAGTVVTVRAKTILDGDRRVGTLLTLRAINRQEPEGTPRRGPRPSFGWGSLTDTERTVIALVGEGLTNREAGQRLFMSRHTVDFHLRSIYRKLDIRSRMHLARLAMKHSQC
jgi:DNA-binding CsgD family transcriptional regulator